MYQIQGSIIEQHGQYQVSLRVYRDDALALNLVVRAFDNYVLPAGESGDEHQEIVDVLMTVLRRTAEKYEQKIF